MGRKSWTDEDDDNLRKLYPLHTKQELCEMLGRTEGAIRNRCNVLGLNTKVKPIEDLTGSRIGPLLILGKSDKLKTSSSSRWLCCCTICGNEFSIADYWLRHSNPYNHCVCTKFKQFSRENNPAFRHGGSKTTLYNRWCAMLTRTTNPNAWNYKHYGERGITVCEEWKDFAVFEQWCLSHGWNESMSVDRINNDKGYSPDNCRVIPLNEQQANRRPFNSHKAHNQGGSPNDD